MKKKLLNNWGLKLLSLAIAFTLWFLVINVTDPTDSKDFSNIPVKLVHTEVLDDDKVFEILDGTGTIRNVTVTARTSVLRELTENDIVAEADFNNLTATQTIEVDFYSTRSNKEIDKITGNTGFVKLKIEDKKTKYLTLKVNVTGNVAEGFILDSVRPDQNRITITGPESVVSKITDAAVDVDVTDATDNVITKSEIVLYDAEGNEVTSDSLRTSMNSVSVSAYVNATKWVPVHYNVTGVPAEGYAATGEVTSAFSRALVSGSSAVLNKLKSIEIPESVLDITGKSENMVVTVNLNEYLPAGVALVDKNYNEGTVVTVHIEKEYEKEYKVKGTQIHVTGLPAGISAKVEPDAEYILVLSGLQKNLDAIQEIQLSGTIAVDEFMKRENIEILKPGIYRIEPDFGLSNEIHIVEPAVVSLTVEPGI